MGALWGRGSGSSILCLQKSWHSKMEGKNLPTSVVPRGVGNRPKIGSGAFDRTTKTVTSVERSKYFIVEDFPHVVEPLCVCSDTLTTQRVTTTSFAGGTVTQTSGISNISPNTRRHARYWKEGSQIGTTMLGNGEAVESTGTQSVTTEHSPIKAGSDKINSAGVNPGGDNDGHRFSDYQNVSSTPAQLVWTQLQRVTLPSGGPDKYGRQVSVPAGVP